MYSSGTSVFSSLIGGKIQTRQYTVTILVVFINISTKWLVLYVIGFDFTNSLSLDLDLRLWTQTYAESVVSTQWLVLDVIGFDFTNSISLDLDLRLRLWT